MIISELNLSDLTNTTINTTQRVQASMFSLENIRPTRCELLLNVTVYSPLHCWRDEQVIHLLLKIQIAVRVNGP